MRRIWGRRGRLEGVWNSGWVGGGGKGRGEDTGRVVVERGYEMVMPRLSLPEMLRGQWVWGKALPR